MAAKRIALFDVLKGIAIFMVVMGHVLTMCIRGIDAAGTFKVIGEVHMPLFFFISGWMCWRPGPDGRGQQPRWGQRALQLLLPMVAVSSLWIYWFPLTGLESPLDSTFAGLWGDMWKNGYWFTPVLFEIIVLYALVRLLPGMKQGNPRAFAVVLGAGALFIVAGSYLPADLAGYTSLPLAARFFPAFGVGVAAAANRERFMAFCRRGWVMAAAIVSSIVLLRMSGWYWQFDLSSLGVEFVRAALHVALVVAAVGVFAGWSETASRAVGFWAFLGRKSLGIYLWHYFFLFPLGFVRPALEATALGIVPLLAVAAATAAAVVACTLAWVYVLEKSSPLALVFLGITPKKTVR